LPRKFKRMAAVADAAAAGQAESLPWILVTGGLGFIGSHVVEHLGSFGTHRIMVADARTYAVQPASVAALESLELVEVRTLDLRDPMPIKDLMAEVPFEMVMHFAAESHVDRSFGNSTAFTATNVMGTHNLLEAWRCSPHRYGLKAFVHVSTDEVHGSIEHDLDDPDQI